MALTSVPLGRLERVLSLREVWPGEAANFTPWLAQDANLAILGEALGIRMELEATERWIGRYKLDILAKDIFDGTEVVIENQFGRTDHNHLGQLLTYAAGRLNGRKVVWVAEKFEDEHRAAIDFLNRATGEEYSFFAVELELYRIGESAPAPRFSVVAKPNGWNKSIQAIRQDNELTSDQQCNLEYWSLFIDSCDGRSPFEQTKPPRTRWMRVKTLRREDDFKIVLFADFDWKGRLRLALYIEGSGTDVGSEFANFLVREKEYINGKIEFPLTWDNFSSKKCIVAAYMPGEEKLESRNNWTRQHCWLRKSAPKLICVLESVIQQLDHRSAEEIQK